MSSPAPGTDGARSVTPGGQSLSLFSDAHGFMRNVSEEMEQLKKLIETEDEKRRLEAEELRRDQEQERFERRGTLNKLRYEFEDYVKMKLDKVLREASTLKKSGVNHDVLQQQQINGLITDFESLRESLFSVQSAWGKLVHNCVTPYQHQQMAQARGNDFDHEVAAILGGDSAQSGYQRPAGGSPSQR
eukprot:TRINITY_DN2952_c0_g1_i1.p1 TRINITY_DN2952_c0_g1~~TRINITY_DN2952_c0_g1_i1.p1  ORF type:complete len:188 (+),score=37.58 TRINITY_DN2952_c0_g1_i1:36-599(+)